MFDNLQKCVEYLFWEIYNGKYTVLECEINKKYKKVGGEYRWYISKYDILTDMVKPIIPANIDNIKVPYPIRLDYNNKTYLYTYVDKKYILLDMYNKSKPIKLNKPLTIKDLQDKEIYNGD